MISGLQKRVLFLLAVAVVSLGVTTTLFWKYEHGTNPALHGIFDVVYWWVVTSATVGYGDIVPLTWQGRGVTILAIVTGFFIYTSLIAVVVEASHAYIERKERGLSKVKVNHHIVICEYTAVADELIQSLSQLPEFAARAVVIIADLVSRNPYPQHQFVAGLPINPMVLRQANVEQADYVFVFANLRFADPDVKTLHIASRVRDMNPNAKVFIEMVNTKHDLLVHASGDVTVMDSRKLMECVLKHEKIDPAAWAKLDTRPAQTGARLV